MKTELFIGVPQHEPNKIVNPTFKGTDGWHFSPAMDTHYIYDNICFFGKETDAEATYAVWTDDLINEVGYYKVTFEMFENEEIKGGELTVTLGDATYLANTIGTHTFIANVTDTTSKILFFNNYSNTYRGITNVTIETADVVYENIDLFDDVAVPLNFSVADLKDLSKKNSSFSKTVSIPGTPSNNIFFKHIYNISATGTYILNKAVPCRLLQDTMNIFNGYFELTKVIVRKDEYIYEGNIYSTFKSLFTEIGSKLIVGNESIIDNIPLSEFDHVKTLTQVVDKLNDTDNIDSYGYIFVDKDGRYQYKTTVDVFTVQQMTATLPIKVLWDKIFEKAGYKYESTFLNSDNFKHLIMPYPDHDMIYSQDMIDKYSATGNNTANTVVYKTFSTSLGEYPIAPIYDTIEYTPEQNVIVYNGGNFTTKIGGTYKISIDKALKFRLKGNANTWSKYTYDPIWLSARNVSSTMPFYFVFRLNLSITRNGTQIIEQLHEWHNQYDSYTPYYSDDDSIDIHYGHPDTGPYYTNPNSNVLNMHIAEYNNIKYAEAILTTFDSFTKDYDFLEGDSAYLYIEVDLPNGFPPTYCNAYSSDDLFVTHYPVNWNLETYTDAESFNFELQSIKKEGAYIYGSDIPHQKMKQSDFITSIIKMFNLYVEPIDETTLRIEPRDDYYANFGTLKDWSDKADISKDIFYERPSELIEQVLTLKYDDDDDSLNKTYLANTLESYGSNREIYEQNIDLTNTAEIKVTFAPTVCGPLEGSSRVLMPKIYALKDDGLIDATKKFKPRILLKNDMLLTNDSSLLHLNSLNTSISITYPGIVPNYVSHFNKPYGAEDYNINFGGLKWNYEQITWPARTGETWANLTYNYYRKMLDQITHSDSKLVTMYFNLLTTDISNLSMADTIQVNDTRYYIQKIFDYVAGQPTKVELLKIIDTATLQTDYEPIVKQFDGEKIFDTPVTLPTTINLIPIVNEVPTIPVITEVPRPTDVNNGQLAANTIDKKLYVRLDTEIKEVKLKPSIGTDIIDILYADLKALYDTSTMQEGCLYRITDYATVHYMMDGDVVFSGALINTGVNEPLIVFATSSNTLALEAYSTLHPGDIIHYDITAGTTNSDMAIWGDYSQPAIISGFKGFITYREDTIQNVKCQYDFRNVKFYRYQIDCDLTWVYPNTYTDFTTNTLVEYSGSYYKCLVEFGPGESIIAPDVDWQHWTYIGEKNRNLYWSIDWINQTLFNNAYVGLSNVTSVYTFGDYYNRVFNVEIGSSNNVTRLNDIVFYTSDDPNTCRDNIIKSGNKVTFGDGIYNNYIGTISSCFVYDEFYFNTLKHSYNNTIAGGFTYNNIGEYFQGNNIGENFGQNTIGNFFYENDIGSEFSDNKIVFNMYGNKIYTNFTSNTIGSSFFNNTIDHHFANNTTGNFFYNNTTGNFFYNNQIGNYFGTYEGATTAVGNTIGNYFQNNTIGNYFPENTIGNYFQGNTIGDSFQNNTIGNEFTSNTTGIEFTSNTIGNAFKYNNFIYSPNNIDFTTATHVYGDYNCEITRNSALQIKLKYLNSSNVETFVDPTS